MSQITITYKYKCSYNAELLICQTTIDRDQISIQLNKNDNFNKELYTQTNRFKNYTISEIDDILNGALSKYKLVVESLKKPSIEKALTIIYSHFEIDNVFQSSHLNFQIGESHVVGINNCMLKKQFNCNTYLEAYEKLNLCMLNLHDYPRLTFNVQDVAIFEEQIEIEHSNFKYYGYKDCEPYDQKKVIFECHRLIMQSVINSFINYTKRTKTHHNK